MVINTKLATKTPKQSFKPRDEIKSEKIISPKEGREKRKKGTENQWDKYKTNNKMLHFSLTISITTVRINGLNTLVKRQRMSRVDF